ncbi:CoA pyrophosphatase [Jatrophihabitans endophyticus]|uniref:NUDIX hydrolase n=1 Tax=Jatrophihabitans endophyticus TaxID=1206085 RepID=UPI0026EAA751|nr:CoA pyrophosphatase [Jatrophihabitans endophyticus]
MSSGPGGGPGSGGPAPLPDWLSTLARAAGSIGGTDLSRFLPPEDGSGRPSAVLMVFTDGPGGPSVLLLQRASSLRDHAGQVAFPGGALDPGDDGPVAAALREANEEVGLDPASVRVVAELPSIYIPVSGFVVTPVLAWWERPHPIRAGDAAEVARVAVVPLAELADPADRFTVTHPSGFVGPGFEAQGLFVWGFTAGLLDRMMHFGGWEQPWDRARRRGLPTVPAE